VAVQERVLVDSEEAVPVVEVLGATFALVGELVDVHVELNAATLLHVAQFGDDLLGVVQFALVAVLALAHVAESADAAVYGHCGLELPRLIVAHLLRVSPHFPREFLVLLLALERRSRKVGYAVLRANVAGGLVVAVGSFSLDLLFEPVLVDFHRSVVIAFFAEGVPDDHVEILLIFLSE